MRTILDVSSLKSTIKELKNNYSFEEVEIHCHPDNLYILEKLNKESHKAECPSYFQYEYPSIKICTNKYLDKYAKRWEFPECPAYWSGNYWEYTKEDESWAIPIGHGKWVEDKNSPVFYKINKNFFKFEYLNNFSIFKSNKLGIILT